MLPNTFTELSSLIRNGTTVDVDCLKKVEDLETYVEARMRLTIIDATPEDRDGVIVLTVSYAKYEEINKTFESHNYFDKNGVACLNARQAGFFSVEDTLYVMNTDDPNDYFIMLEDSANYWIQEYLKHRNKDETYVAFLERLLDQAKDGFSEGKFYNY